MQRLRCTRVLSARHRLLHSTAPANPRHSGAAARQPHPPSQDVPAPIPSTSDHGAAQRLAWRRAHLPIDKEALMKVAALLSEESSRPALSVAQGHLTTLKDHDVPIPIQAATYHALISLFLRHSDGAKASRSLLKRQIAEGIPLTSKEAMKAIHALRGEAGTLPLREFTDLLPDSFSPDLLAEVMHLLVHQSNPPPASVHETISQVMAAYNREQGYPAGVEHRWPWPLRVVVMEAYLVNDDFVGALRALRVLKTAAQEQREQEEDWPGEGGQVLCAAYASVMGAWVRTAAKRHRMRAGSNIPRRLARDLANLLSKGAPDFSKLSVPFLNAWMNAERAAENPEQVELIWRVISGQRLADTVAGKEPERRIDPFSWKALFKYLKTRPPQSYRPLARLVLSNRPSSPTLNDLLAAVVAAPEPDLALILHLIPTTPTPRTVDLVASALIRTSRNGTDPSLGRYNAFPRVSATDINITEAEWDWVGRLLAQYAELRASADARSERAEDVQPASRSGSAAEGGSPPEPASEKSSSASQIAPPPEETWKRPPRSEDSPVKPEGDLFAFPASRSLASHLPLRPTLKGDETYRAVYLPRPASEMKQLLELLDFVLRRCLRAAGQSEEVDLGFTKRVTGEAQDGGALGDSEETSLDEILEDDFVDIKKPQRWARRAERLQKGVAKVGAQVARNADRTWKDEKKTRKRAKARARARVKAWQGGDLLADVIEDLQAAVKVEAEGGEESLERVQQRKEREEQQRRWLAVRQRRQSRSTISTS